MRTPGTLVALRILAWVQVGLMLIGLVVAGVAALVASTALDSDEELTQGSAALGVIVGVLVAVF